MFDFKNGQPTILLVDDEPDELEAYRFLLLSMGLQKVETLQDSRQVMARLPQLDQPIVFLDLNMPHKSGLELLGEIKDALPQVPVVICTANSEIETAVECLRRGAHDYLVKPINANSFGSALRSAAEIQALRSEVFALKGIGLGGDLKQPEAFRSIVTGNSQMLNMFRYLEAIAGTGQPLLILGETGTGKELVARAVHQASGLAGEFVAVDVSGLDDMLFSDALFGHVRGAYTGADNLRPGLIEKAKGGTLFLDEIGDLGEASQVKLLRLLQEKTYYPLGSDTPKHSAARIIAAANKSQPALAGGEEGFRQDLYYRLSTHLVKLAPLRERREDIALLAETMIREAAVSMGRDIPQLSPQALRLLQAHDFPGNIRELKTYLFDSVARAFTGEITPELISERLHGIAPAVARTSGEAQGLEALFGYFPTLDQLGEFAVDSALQRTGFNQSQAARLLGISKQALHKRLKKREQGTAPS
ncbi:sigma-54-dependent transcriptional regulator [Pelobacter seleniigenes]|uniref:sigma-54-dependent transcriptional regulator n=1 Tax=Pelobacter seleniigenes TaxID=407188 RepID=UPI0004A73D40|nr:sigma-54 dependent transcriptional regulator [Pelobacter seleniigenes]